MELIHFVWRCLLDRKGRNIGALVCYIQADMLLAQVDEKEILWLTDIQWLVMVRLF